MAWYDYLFDSEWNQRADINALRETSRRAAASDAKQRLNHSRKLNENERKVDDLRVEVERLNLLVRALYVYAKEHGGMDGEKFHQIVKRIDAMDGEEDGRASL